MGERQGHKHAALASVTQANSSEIAHLQQQLEGRGSELHGARRALAGKEATWLELRWFCTREEEGPLFAALLMYQAMRRDAMVAPTCRIRTPFAVLNMTEHELAQCNGLSVCSVRPQWRMPPREHEDFLQAFLHDSPLREDVEHFIHMRRRG